MGKLADLGIEVGEAVIDNVAVSSILETIGDHDLKSVPIDLLKDLPILRTLAVSCSIRDIVFMSKLKSFLRSLDDLPKDKIRHEIEKIDKSKKYRQKVGENIINLIDQSFDDDSAENIALLFRTFLKEQISYDEFMASSRIVCKLSREDILRFCGDFTYLKGDTRESYNLLWTGLVDFTYEPIENVEVEYNPGGTFEDSKTGREYDYDDGYSSEVIGGEMKMMATGVGKVIYKVFKEISA